MKRNILDEETPDEYDGILKAPDIGGVIGAYRMSAASSQTFATTTTRASSVMPPAQHNLGLSRSMNEDMTAEEALEEYGNSEVGKKNQEVTGNSVLPLPVAAQVNLETRQAQDKAIQEEFAKQEALESKQSKSKITRYLLFAGIGLIVLVAIAGGAFAALSADDGNSEANDDETDDDNSGNPDPNSDPDPNSVFPVRITDFEPTTLANFEFMCKNIPELEDHFFCLQGSILDCVGEEVTPIQGCTCECEGFISSEVDCSLDQTTQCSTDFEVSFTSEVKALELNEIIIFMTDCENGNEPSPLCIFENQNLFCSDNNVALQLPCDGSCGCTESFCPSSCESLLIELGPDAELDFTVFEENFCNLVNDEENYVSCGPGQNNNVACPVGGDRIFLDCDPGDLCRCQENGIVKVDQLTDACVFAATDRSECPVFEASVSVDNLNDLLDLFTSNDK